MTASKYGMEPAASAVFTVGVGKPLGAQQTLAEFEAELAKLRAMGAPDDAVVSRAVPGSIYAIEAVWIGPVRT